MISMNVAIAIEQGPIRCWIANTYANLNVARMGRTDEKVVRCALMCDHYPPQFASEIVDIVRPAMDIQVIDAWEQGHVVSACSPMDGVEYYPDSDRKPLIPPFDRPPDRDRWDDDQQDDQQVYIDPFY